MNLIEKMTGYKATDENMRCKSYQFELGKEYVHDGKLVMCESGFHFCTHPSGVWAYYNEPGTRVFKIEAYDVHPVCLGSGAIVKYVAKRIKFIEEVKIEGEGNTGDYNTGNYNTGDFNTGDGNTGNWNTGIGNATNRSSGFFCDIEHKVLSFNIQTNLTYNAYMRKYPEVINLSKELLKDKPIDFEKYKRLPGITEEKLKALHKKFIDRSTK